jgi:hypothetical protein
MAFRQAQRRLITGNRRPLSSAKVSTCPEIFGCNVDSYATSDFCKLLILRNDQVSARHTCKPLAEWRGRTLDW